VAGSPQRGHGMLDEPWDAEGAGNAGGMSALLS
jgi:hypothetical protein